MSKSGSRDVTSSNEANGDDEQRSRVAALLASIAGSPEEQERLLREGLTALEANMAGNDAPPNVPAPNERRSSSRASRRSSVSEPERVVSYGGPINACRLPRYLLKNVSSEQRSKYLYAVDFVHMDNQDLEYVFATERTYDRFPDRQLEFPPPHFRRNASDIKKWFNEFGADARKKIIEDTSTYELNIEHDDTLQ